MKFVKDLSPKGFLIPPTSMKLAGFQTGQKLEYHAMDNAVAVLKGSMTAMELLAAATENSPSATGWSKASSKSILWRPRLCAISSAAIWRERPSRP